jgi:hypothetical protein
MEQRSWMRGLIECLVVPVLLGSSLLPAQEPEPDTPAAAEVDAPRKSEPIGDRLIVDLQAIHEPLEAQRAKVIQALEIRIEGAEDEAERQRLKTDLETFVVSEVLPASAPKEAKEFEDVRTAALGRERAAVQRAIAAYEKAENGEAATKLGEDLQRIEERLDEVAWRDLRCYPGFVNSMARSGFVWEGTTLVSPVDKAASLRLPSPLDTTLYSHYQLRFELERVSGTGSLRVLFPMPDCPPPDRALGSFVIDASNGGTSGLENADGAESRFATTHSGALLDQGNAVVIVMTCKNDRIRVAVDGSEVCDFDDVKHLRLPKALQAQFRDAMSSVHLLPADGAQFRLLGAGFRVVTAQTLATAARYVPRQGLPEDCLPLRSVFRGHNANGVGVTLKVIARNQALRTARIELRGKNGWLVRIDVTTNANGTQFQLEDAKRYDAKVKLFDESGSGTVNGDHIKVWWRWRNAKAGAKGVYEDSFSGKR